MYFIIKKMKISEEIVSQYEDMGKNIITQLSQANDDGEKAMHNVRLKQVMKIMNNLKPVLGIIGGSGVYEIEGLQNKHWDKVESSFGKPSDELLFGELDGHQLVFLPRHGRGHLIPPSEINYRANIDAINVKKNNFRKNFIN